MSLPLCQTVSVTLPAFCFSSMLIPSRICWTMGSFPKPSFPESCVFHRGNYVKDLSRLGRDLNKVIIVDNSPASYIFHPDNAVRYCLPFFFCTYICFGSHNILCTVLSLLNLLRICLSLCPSILYYTFNRNSSLSCLGTCSLLV